MRKIIFTWILHLVFPSSVHAQKAELRFGPMVSHTSTDLSFSVSGDEEGRNPNIFSELIWEDIRAVRYGAKGLYSIGKVEGELCGSIARAYRGKVSDTDYRFDDRQGIFYLQNLSAHNSGFVGLSVHITYQLTELSKPFRLKIGPSYSFERLTLRIGNFKTYREGLDYVEGIDSYYHPSWNTIGLRTDCSYTHKEVLTLDYAVDVHYAILNAQGSWNLRDDLRQPVSYRQRLTTGNKLLHHISLSYPLHGKSTFRIGYTLDTVSGKKGRDVVYFSDNVSVLSQLNEVRRQHTSWSLGFEWRLQ